MHLTRCQDQRSRSLDEFYVGVTQQESVICREGGQAMLDLIARLRALPDKRLVFGLTSHHRLCLLAEDTYRSPWFVIISALDKRNYYVEYLMPERIAPWPHAYVKGEARSEDDAVQMIVTAMEKAEGWRTMPNKIAPPEPPPTVLGSSALVHPTLDSLPAPGSGGGR